jgi:hypothetical protein
VIVAAPSQRLCPTTLRHLAKAGKGSPLPLGHTCLLVGYRLLVPTAILIIIIHHLAKPNTHPLTPHTPHLHCILLILSTRNVALQPTPPTLFPLVPHHIARASHAAALSCAYDSDTAAYPARDPQYGAFGDTQHGAVQYGTIVPCLSRCLVNERHTPPHATPCYI